MPEPQKKLKRQGLSGNDSDSDSDSDGELMTPVFGTTRCSKRRKTKDEETKKKKRMAQMNALLDNGRIKLERESRMDKLCEQNNELMREEYDEVEMSNHVTSSSSYDKSVKSNGCSLRVKQQMKNNHYQQINQSKDANETSCLGSRSTLHFSRLLCTKTLDGPLSPCWFGVQDAFADLRTILLADEQLEQENSPFTPLRKELLRLCTTKSPHDFCMYLKKRLLCEQEDRRRIQLIPVNVLRWLMALAYGPIVNINSNGCFDNYLNKIESTYFNEPQKNLGKDDNCSGRKCLFISTRLLMEAQTGAHRTLYRLWSQDLGFPLQQHQQERNTYLLSILALPGQLRQWFGSSFPIERIGNGSEKNIFAEEVSIDQFSSSTSPMSSSSPQVTTTPIYENKKQSLRVTSTRATIIRFLQLWALCLQKQNEHSGANTNPYLVHFHYDIKNRSRFQTIASNAIIGVLWVGLNPSFASSNSAKDDGTKYIRSIVGCLLERVRWEKNYYNCEQNVINDGESFKQWLQTLSERICVTWSKQLGRGQKGTDAYEDENAWLCLARSVTLLFQNDGNDCEKHGGMKNHNFGERIVPCMRDFELSLCRCILRRAIVIDLDLHQSRDIEATRDEQKCESEFNDWVSSCVDEEMQKMKVPFNIRSSKRWQTLCLSVVGLDKLAHYFPEGEASKCFALIDICSVCFHSAIIEIEIEIRKYCLKGNRDRNDNNEDMHFMNDNLIGISSQNADEISERHALYNAFVSLEDTSEVISNMTRLLIMQNVCFPWASHMAESLRNYIRSQKEKYAPPDARLGVEPIKQQSRISTFFKNKEASDKIITN
mmetsp:Transcript_9887/g.24038  ORF Transcript_9887/g.24038 Transcript_9887/m.24038 type:complete len:825 (+) Transcript_9887:180-2654(+)